MNKKKYLTSIGACGVIPALLPSPLVVHHCGKLQPKQWQPPFMGIVGIDGVMVVEHVGSSAGVIFVIHMVYW